MVQDPRFYAALARAFEDYQLEIRSDFAAKFAQENHPKSKKNSELLNSLLGLPKNILRSG